MINNITGEKTIDLSYPIRNFDSSKEITVISMLSNNVQYEMTEPLGLKLIDGSEKQVLNKTYTKREIDALVERKLYMIFNLNELDNSDNLKDGRPSNALFTCYVPGSEDFTHFEPVTPQYKKLKSGKIVSLTLRITDQNDNIITDGPGTTVVLHIR